MNPKTVRVLLAALVITAGDVQAQAAPTPSGLASIAVGTDAAPDPAAAGDDEAAAPTIDSIVVTAQKRAEPINAVPIAISAFSGEMLDALGVTDTRDLGLLVPGLSYADSGYTTPIYTLRGIGFNDTTYNATSTVGVYVDEVNLPYSVMSKGANLDLERIEVLKGPQGTLYGRNTTGGLINYIANKPGEVFEAGLRAGYSSFQTVQSEGYLSGPLGDSLRGRIALRDIRSFEGWQYSLTRPDDELGRQDRQAVRGALDWTPREDLSLRLALETWRDNSDAQAPQPIGVIAQNGAIGELALSPQIRFHPLVSPDSDNNRVADWSPAFDWRLDEQFHQLSSHLKWQLGAARELVAIVSHAEIRDDHSYLPQSGYSVLNAEQALDARIRSSAVELRLASTDDADFSWMLGGNLSRDDGSEYHKLFIDTNSTMYPLLGEALIASRLLTFGEHEAAQYAGFASGSWQFAETFALDTGARYTHDHRRFAGCTLEPDDSQGLGLTNVFNLIALSRGRTGAPIARGDCLSLDAEGGNALTRDTLAENNLSGRLALNWTPSADALVYLSLSRGFKSGGFPVLSASDQVQYTPVRQEELRAFELGTKHTLWKTRAQFNLATFYYDYRDKQLLTRLRDPVFGPLPILRNAPKSRVVGVEGELRAAPLAGLALSAAGSYLRTRIDRFESTGFDGRPADFSGKPFNLTPELQFTLLADYSLMLGERLLGGFGIDYRYTGDANSTLDESPLFAHEAYGLINLRARLEDSQARWTLAAYVQNLRDERYTLSIIQTGEGAARFVGRPRTVGVMLSYRWF